MNAFMKVLDFWLGDFKWYRESTNTNRYEWLCKHETTIFGQETNVWQRHPKGTLFMINVIKQMIKDNPNIKSLSQVEQRAIVEKYINIHYNQN